jgi:His-Xaa-Ser system radical SAM maturase HxsC
MFGIPLYSANPARHDFVVQAKGAFDQTIRGILNAKRCGLKVELRVVLHEQTVPTLRDLGRFICRNLPFVDQVALMGLEHIGYVKANAGALKVHPREYSEDLKACVGVLSAAGIRTYVFNLPLCFLPSEVWRFAQRSISDWKNDIPPACERCAARQRCGGFFSWNVSEFAESVRPFSPAEVLAVEQSSRESANTILQQVSW